MNEKETINPMWMARAGEGGAFFQWFVDKGVVAIQGAITASGEDKVGDLSGLTTKEEIEQRIDKTFPVGDPHRKKILTDILHKYCNEMQIGDHVLTYSPSERIYALGEITSKYEFNPNLKRPHTRKTNFLPRRIFRDNLSASTKNALASNTIIYQARSEAAKEILRLVGHVTTPRTSGATYSEATYRTSEAAKQTEADDGSNVENQFDFQSLSDRIGELIKDLIVDLEWDEMEKLVAGLLRAMDYKTRRTPKGPDGGIDIVASKDALGFEKPTIAVEVKHRKSSIDVKDIRSFLSVCRSYDGGLFVSTGGFTKDARQLAQHSEETITIMDIDTFLGYFLDYYDKLDDETQSLLPLGKLYLPKG